MATVYISPTGNDTTGDGSEGTPWATLTKAVAETVADDTIIALAGTYTWNTLGDLEDNRTLRGATGDPADVIFDGGGNNFTWVGQNATTTSGACTVEFITFKSIHRSTSGACIQAGSGGPSDRFSFNNCIFHDFELYSTASSGGLIDFGNLAPAATTTRLQNCLIYDIRKNTNASTAHMFILNNNVSSSSRLELYQTTVYLDANTDVIDTMQRRSNVGGTSSFIFDSRNSIYVNEGNAAISFANSGTYVTHSFSHNCVYASTNPWTGTYTLDANSITVNPQFIDAPNQDFRLRPGSPCLFTGGVI